MIMEAVAVAVVGVSAAAPRPAPTPDPDVLATRAVSQSTAAGVRRWPWGALAECESSGRWGLNVGRFDGGLQFHPDTWREFSDPTDPPYAYQATPERQIEIATRVSGESGFASSSSAPFVSPA